MKITTVNSQSGELIDGPKLIHSDAINDSRGFFMESWNKKRFNEIGLLNIDFVQDNHSSSSKGVLRGLHYQKSPHAQGKLVRCISGEIFDVAVDLRRTSPTFGQWVGVKLDEYNHQQFWIPHGFAHGFLTLSKSAQIIYKVTDYWFKDFDRVLSWKDPSLAIDWPIANNLILSEKDSAAPFLSQLSDDELF